MKETIDKIKKVINKNQTLFSIIFITIIACFITAVMLRNGLLRGHDLTFHLSRIKGLKDSLSAGDLKALIHVGLYGYGYANGLFYGNLFIYPFAILNLLGLSLCKSYVVFMLLCNIISGISMFVLVKKISKSNLAGMISSILYTCAAYRICDVVIRAAVGEMLAFMIIPIVILGLYEIIYGDCKKFYIFSIGFVLLVQVHIISTVIMAIICIALLLVNIYALIDEKERIKYLIYSVIFGLLLGSFFIFPLLEQYVSSDLLINNLKTTSSIANTIIPFERLFFGISYYSTSVFYPPGIGIILILISILRFRIKSSDKKLLKFCDICLITGIISLICITDFFPWKELSKYLGFMQFSWRLYLFATVFLCISSGIITYLYLKERKNNKIPVYITIFSVLSACINIYYSFYAVHNYWSVSGMEYLSDYNDYYIGTGEYLPYKTDIEKLSERGEKITTNNPNLEFKYKRKGNKFTVEYSNNEKNDTYIELPLLYYLGYGVKSNDTNYKITSGRNNIIRVYLSSKSDKIVIYYKGTMIQKVSYIVSFITLVVFLYFIIRRRGLHESKKKNKKSNRTK